jgi:toxin ParE1/3/4
MTSDVDWSPRARKDLSEIYDFIGVQRESPVAAKRLIESIRKKAEAYASQPSMGTLHSDIEIDFVGASVRSFRVKSYLAFYRETPLGIYVLRVLHGRRDYRSLL